MHACGILSVYVSTTTDNGEKGGVKRLKDNVPWRLLGLEMGKSWLTRACRLCPGMVLRDCVWLTDTHTLSPSVQLTCTSTAKQRPHKEQKQAGEASWLKEVRKGEE